MTTALLILLVAGFALGVWSLRRQMHFSPRPIGLDGMGPEGRAAAAPTSDRIVAAIAPQAAAPGPMRYASMKKVEALIHPSALDDLRAGLLLAGIEEMSVCDASVLRPRRHRAWYNGAEFMTWYERRCKVEVLIDGDRVPDCLEVIRAHGGVPEHDARITILDAENVLGTSAGAPPRRGPAGASRASRAVRSSRHAAAGRSVPLRAVK